jgi:starch phosphorylase
MDVLETASVVERRGLDRQDLKRSILEKLVYAAGKDPEHAVPRDWCVALSLAVRDRLVDRWMPATRRSYQTRQKRVYYLSMEFLIGRLLADTIENLGLGDACRDALVELGVDYDIVRRSEPDPALGNGGLGRLAACFLDSMTNLGIAAYGYGIRYQHGLFRQSIMDGQQAEQPEDWLSLGNPWEFERPEAAYRIGFGGQVGMGPDGRAIWEPAVELLASAYDMPISGWRGSQVNTLRLWDAKAPTVLDLAQFNRGNFLEAAEQQVLAETLSRVLYPDDSTAEGKTLRLKQEYFFTSASLQDLLRRFLQDHEDLGELPDQVAIQLNDTHPAIAVPELVRLLLDEHGLDFTRAFAIARGCIAYTNHTLLPEALERWPIELLASVLPRHMQIIEEIDRQLATEVARLKTTAGLADVRVIEGGNVLMGNLAFVGSHRVNGVSALHTDLMRKTVFRSLHKLYPDRIVNQTNGITPRRWLHGCNPGLSGLLHEAIGDSWVGDLEAIGALVPHAEDKGFRDRFAAVKRANKERLCREIQAQLGLDVDPGILFDVQIKRFHEYKRQLLNALETIALYHQIRRSPNEGWLPRVKIFAGKAAPSYMMAKLIIRLIHDVARVVNNDPDTSHLLRVVFLPNYNVSLAELIVPAADLSEQISTAGMEASGTGNMKLALNGALTLGTLDGANVEICEHVGADNIFIFGLTADEVAARRANGHDPRAEIASDPILMSVIDAIRVGEFSQQDPNRYAPLVDSLVNSDYFMVTADFTGYFLTQREIDRAFRDQDDWTRRAVLNTANVGWFSSDRTIRGYAADIWNVPVPPA